MGNKTGKPRGRPAGAKNRRTAAREAKMAEVSGIISETVENAFEGDSHALLMAVYKNPAHDWDVRIDAAKAAIGYEKPRLGAVQLQGDKDNPIAMTVTWKPAVKESTDDPKAS